MRNWGTSTLLSLLTTTLCFASSPSFSEPLPPALEGKVQLLKAGEKARVAGVLLDREALLTILRSLEERAKLAEAAAARAGKDADARVETIGKVADASVAAERSKAAACEADKIRRERVYEDALKRCQVAPPSWKYYLATGIGAVVAGGICVGSVAASR